MKLSFREIWEQLRSEELFTRRPTPLKLFRARHWYSNILGLADLEMENGLKLLLMNWGENHKPINDGAVFSLYSPDIKQAHESLKARGATVDEVARYGADYWGFHVTDSEGNLILIIDQAS
ncbi:hypothetical protein A7K91_17245 [Paenibacillus oryzae]|uniref:VOC domain-containing protein n=1 Tax=Paenibacillus oryzae TaxID=1844972 RepID=A0A1A5YJP4_9BACL|nr:VOC family protein [Paenibacillus oryzae]OBR65783.1 hypothetical protein A7K91_17245 [Paenibacillus oryzae]